MFHPPPQLQKEMKANTPGRCVLGMLGYTSCPLFIAYLRPVVNRVAIHPREAGIGVCRPVTFPKLSRRLSRNRVWRSGWNYVRIFLCAF